MYFDIVISGVNQEVKEKVVTFNLRVMLSLFLTRLNLVPKRKSQGSQ